MATDDALKKRSFSNNMEGEGDTKRQALIHGLRGIVCNVPVHNNKERNTNPMSIDTDRGALDTATSHSNSTQNAGKNTKNNAQAHGPTIDTAHTTANNNHFVRSKDDVGLKTTPSTNDIQPAIDHVDQAVKQTPPDKNFDHWMGVVSESIKQGNVTMLEAIRKNTTLAPHLKDIMKGCFENVLDMAIDLKDTNRYEIFKKVSGELRNEAWNCGHVMYFDRVHGASRLYGLTLLGNVDSVTSYVELFNAVFPFCDDPEEAIVNAAHKNDEPMLEALLSLYWRVPDEALIAIYNKIKSESNLKENILARMLHIPKNTFDVWMPSNYAEDGKFKFLQWDKSLPRHFQGKKQEIKEYQGLFRNDAKRIWKAYRLADYEDAEVGRISKCPIHESFVYAIDKKETSVLDLRKRLNYNNIMSWLQIADTKYIDRIAHSVAEYDQEGHLCTYLVSEWFKDKEHLYTNIFSRILERSVEKESWIDILPVIKDHVSLDNMREIIVNAMSSEAIFFVCEAIKAIMTEKMTDDNFLEMTAFLVDTIIERSTPDNTSSLHVYMDNAFNIGEKNKNLGQGIKPMKDKYNLHFSRS